jgi:CheY-like chemotaxis protein
VTLRARADNGALVFEVHDTGCGILPDKLGELFQPFHVVDERSIKLEGTGLGLSICKKLARKMGGDITVESVIGKGSVFSVRLPLEEAAPVIETQRTIVDYQGRRRRILIIDDQPANRIVLRTMLEPLDFLIDEAGEARTALEHIRFAKPDIILMDLMMPGIDGFTLCGQVAALDIVPRPVCLAVSALSGEEVHARCREVGFNELLHKPVNFDLLLEALHTHAAIEWTYGVIQPAPPPGHGDAAPKPPEQIVPPSADEIAALLDLARRGFVRNIETRAGALAQEHPECAAFSRRVMAFVSDFKLKELADWLSSLTHQPIHGPA